MVQCSRTSNTSINRVAHSPYHSPISLSPFQIYSAWETDEVIVFELWRNLAMAMVCVFVITLILLADFKICLMVRQSSFYSRVLRRQKHEQP